MAFLLSPWAWFIAGGLYLYGRFSSDDGDPVEDTKQTQIWAVALVVGAVVVSYFKWGKSRG